jgi:hypothetical protein
LSIGGGVKVMTNRVLIVKLTPITQSVNSVVELLNFLGRPSNPLPESVELADGLQLTKSSKCDVYYCTAQEFCTCPGFHYRRTCKHVKALACIRPHGQSMAKVLEEQDRNLSRMPASYRRIVKAARDAEAEPLELKPEGSFKPFLE